MKLKAPDEARLPFYHNYKLAIGWVLFVLILFVGRGHPVRRVDSLYVMTALPPRSRRREV